MKKILFVADHWKTLDHARDSTLHLAQVAREEFGFECHWAHPEDVFVKDSEFYVSIDGKLTDGADRTSLKKERMRREHLLSSYHSIHWRHDPPVKILTMRLWSLLATQELPMVSTPFALLAWNEKFATLRYKSWSIPSHIVSGDDLTSLKLASGKWILKPSADAASRGVQKLASNSRAGQLKKLVSRTGPWIILQKQDDKIFTHGETRLFILDGKIVGCLRKTSPGAHSILSLDAAMANRPLIEKAKPSKTQLARGKAVARDLKREGVFLATIDFIDERLLEINVTSPGLLRWMDAGVPLEKRLAYQYWKKVIGRFGRAR